MAGVLVAVGEDVGEAVGEDVGADVGDDVGEDVTVGLTMGDFVGTCVGLEVSGTGDFVGDWVGAFVGPPNERPNAVLLAVVASQSRFCESPQIVPGFMKSEFTSKFWKKLCSAPSMTKYPAFAGIIGSVVGHILVIKPGLEGHGLSGVMSQAAHDNEKNVLYSGQSCSPLP